MQAGDRLAHYEIIAPLGSGGMGEVFRARDMRLEREVALKLLPADFAADQERVARFRREAKVLASLNHPNVAQIHGLEEDEGRLCLAMELVEGETLAAAIERGPLPLEELLDVAVQMATGLEEAHAKGIVHRDLKPANVKRDPEGKVKILDFGLARALAGEETTALDPDFSPTITAGMTRDGVILGTAAYMSPEQARGQAVDSRADVWAFGVILWELLAGRRLFQGETVSDTLAMVLRADPDGDALPADLPPSLRRLLQRCLQRDRRQRLHHIADARIVLEEIQRDGTSAFEPADGSRVAASPVRRGASGRIGYAVIAVLALAVIWLSWRGGGGEVEPSLPVRFDLQLESTSWLASERQNLAIAPDGRIIVLVVRTPEGNQLFRRDLDRAEFVPIEGTEEAATPFFSPDGRWVAFTQDGRLRKVAIDGGTPVDLCRTEWGGGAWTSDGRIIITRSYAAGLDVVPADGGEPRALTRPDPESGELGHWWPQLMPDETWVIYTGWSTPIDRARIMAFSLETGEQRVLAEGASFGRWSPTGHLLYVRGGQLLAAPFDRGAMEVTGPAEPVLDDVFLDPNDGYANLDFASDGTLVYVPASVMATPRELVWVDREGEIIPFDPQPRRYGPPRLSPDGRLLAETVVEGQNVDIWIRDLERGTRSRFTFGEASDFNPIWAPDGLTLYFNGEEPMFTVYRRAVDASTEPVLVLREPIDTNPTDVTPDGRLLLVTYADPETNSDIWLVPVDGEGEPRPFLATRFSEHMATVSPDGRWLAYVSNESGRNEVYAVAFPGGGSRIQISTAGGDEPAWSPRGDELFYRSREGYMTVPIDRERSAGSSLAAGRPEFMFSGPFEGDWLRAGYSVSLDARRFLMVHAPLETSPRTVRVVLNWFGELAPPGR
jgi:serine/threonine-protein kinase